MRSPSGWLALTAAVLLLGGTLAFAASTARQRRMGIQQNGTHVTVSFRFPDLFTKAVRRKVDSGLETTVLATLYAYRTPDESRTVGGSARTCLLYRDIWEEDYRATIVTRDGETRHRVATLDELVRICSDVHEVPVARRQAFRPGYAYRVMARLEVNPLSAASVRRIQRWLRNPEPAVAPEGAGIFGSVASLFVNPRIGQAERTLRLRSQPFTVP